MGIDLEVYKKQFSLQSATFKRISHSDAIIAEVYQILTSDKKLFILKICPRNDDYFRELYFLSQLKKNLPVPQVMDAIEPSKGNCGAILMEFLKGELLTESDWSNQLAFEIGAALAHIHSKRTDAYGDLTKPKSLVGDPNLYIKEKFEEELNECRGHVSEEMIAKCSTYFESYQHLLDNVDGPCIVHRDFRPGNLLVFESKLQGIIDWSSARSGFAEQDFGFINEASSQKYKTSLLKGYSSVRAIPNYEMLMPLLQLAKAVAVIGYAVKSGTWNKSNEDLYTVHCKFLHTFDFAKKRLRLF